MVMHNGLNQFYDGNKWAHCADDIPEEDHYAIIEFGSMWIPGDERSRTNPGHGYPERTETKIEYIVFENREAWALEVQRRMLDTSFAKKSFVPVFVRRGKVQMTVNVDVGGLGTPT